MKASSSFDIAHISERLQNDGYVVLRNAVSSVELESLRAVLVGTYQREKASGALFEGGGGISGHLNCYPGRCARSVYDELVEYGVPDIVAATSRTKDNRVRVNCNFNLPNSSPQHYHMDGVFTDEFLICNVAVVDTDLENGAIDVLPGTNREFYKFWQYAVRRKHRLTTRLPLQQGDVLLRKSTLWHRGMPNVTTDSRPMLGFTFGEKSAPTGDPFDLDGGEIKFLPNWYRPSRLGRVRERAFVSVPLLYSGLRFARSLYGNKGYSSW